MRLLHPVEGVLCYTLVSSALSTRFLRPANAFDNRRSSFSFFCEASTG